MFAFIRFDVHWTRIINELQKSAGELFEVFSNTAFVWIGMGQMNKAVATEKKSAENFISGYNLENVTGRRHAHELMFTWATLIRARAHQRCYSKQVVFNVWRRVETKSLFSETTIKDFVRLTDFKIRRRCIYKYKRRSLDIYIYILEYDGKEIWEKTNSHRTKLNILKMNGNVNSKLSDAICKCIGHKHESCR